MITKLVSTENGFYDFDVMDAGSISRATVSEVIQPGDMFNLYYGDPDNRRKEGAMWLSKQGISGYLTGDLEKSIRASNVFISESHQATRL
jgi:hypothetical protein